MQAPFGQIADDEGSDDGFDDPIDEDDFEDKEMTAEKDGNGTNNSGTATTARSDEDFISF